jgi:hypothetical protein
MARPTSTIYQWCTTIANRVAPGASAKSLGFAAGDPVPSGVHNDIMGFLSDWIAWLGPRPTTLVMEPAFLPWVSLVSGGSGCTIVRDLAGPVTITFSSGSSGFAGFVLPVEGGKLTGVSVVVSAIDVTTGGAGTATIDVVMSGSNGTQYATYSDATITTTGTKVIPVVGTAGTTVTRDGFLFMQVQPGTQTAHSITISSFTLTFAATP